MTPTLTTDFQADTFQAEAFQETDCILITDAGIEALTSAPVVADETEEGEADGFTPDTFDKASWVLGLIADRRAAAARIRENAEKMAREQDREADTLEWRFGPALQVFAMKELEGGKKKSLRLYNGVIGYRTKPAALHVTNAAGALAWAKVNLPAAVAESVDKKALAETLLTTGEVVDFARLQPAEECFYIKQG